MIKFFGFTFLFFILLLMIWFLPKPAEREQIILKGSDILFVKTLDAYTSSEFYMRFVEIDQCEYILITYPNYSLTHKGNCKFCNERKLK